MAHFHVSLYDKFVLVLDLFAKMVKLHVKKGEESQFLFETTVEIPITQLIEELIPIFNGRLKVQRICAGNVPLNNSCTYFS